MESKILAVAILALNEQNDIGECIESVKYLSSDIFVFDSFSTDMTREIAQSAGARVINFKWNGQYPKKKQWALDYLRDKYEWVLMLDADERATQELCQEILWTIRKSNSKDGYNVKLEYWFLGKPLRFGLKVRKRILLKLDSSYFPVLDDLSVSNMWEVEAHYQPIILSGSVGNLKNMLVHRDTGSLYDFFARHNRYSDWEAFIVKSKALENKVFESKPLRARLLSKLPAKGFLVFCYSYFLMLGILDGRRGFDFAVNQAFYYWQIKIKSREEI